MYIVHMAQAETPNDWFLHELSLEIVRETYLVPKPNSLQLAPFKKDQTGAIDEKAFVTSSMFSGRR